MDKSKKFKNAVKIIQEIGPTRLLTLLELTEEWKSGNQVAKDANIKYWNVMPALNRLKSAGLVEQKRELRKDNKFEKFWKKNEYSSMVINSVFEGINKGI